MKTLIEQIEGLKNEYGKSFQSVLTYDQAIKDVLNLLQSYPVIHAKALRKKGTGEYYVYQDVGKDVGGWFTCQLPNLLADTATMQNYRALSKKGLTIKPPSDAELVDLTIIVEYKP